MSCPEASAAQTDHADKEVLSLRERLRQSHPPIGVNDVPVWAKERVGLEALDANTVLKPWPDLKVTGRTVEVWSRSYDLDASGLPKAILANGHQLLAAPVRFEVDLKNDGHQIALPKAVQSDLGKGRVVFTGQSHRGGKVATKALYEYDGFTRFDFEFEFSEAPSVRRVELVVPLREEMATMFHGTFARRMLKREKQPESGAIPKGDGVVYADGFMPYFWVGSEHGVGLAWYSESDEWVRPRLNRRTVRLVRKPGVVELRIVYVETPTKLAASMSFSFGLMATPVKPLPEGWQNWRVEWDWDNKVQLHPEPAENHLVSWHNNWSLTMFSPVPLDPEAFKRRNERFHNDGVKRIYAYHDVTLMSTQATLREADGTAFVFECPVWKRFGHEWINVPEKEGADYDTASWYPETERVSPASGWADYALWGIREMVLKSGLSGIYTDEAFPYADTSAAHGMGYADPDGIRRPTFSIYATRDYYKRMAWILQKHGKGLPAIMAHTSMTMAVPYLSFADIAIDGEHLASEIMNWKGKSYASYLELLSPDTFRAQMMSQQLGLVPVLLPVLASGNYLRKEPYPKITQEALPTREILALTLAHGTLVWPLYCNRKEVDTAYNELQQFGVTAPDTRFHPYWKEANRAAVRESDGTLMSYYKREGSLLMILVNTRNVERNAEVDLSGILPDGEEWSVVRGADMEAFVPGERKMNIPMTPRDFRMILIRK